MFLCVYKTTQATSSQTILQSAAGQSGSWAGERASFTLRQPALAHDDDDDDAEGQQRQQLERERASERQSDDDDDGGEDR